MARFEIAVFEGDGIGPEVMAPTLGLLEAISRRRPEIAVAPRLLPAGARCYLETGVSLPKASIDAARRADAILLAAAGLPDVRYPNGTEIVPQIELRIELDLYAGVRPVFKLPGVGRPLRDEVAGELDFILVRESTEGLFHSLGKSDVIADAAARETLQITRPVSEKLFDFAFRLAARRKRAGGGPGLVHCVDKANVFGAFAFFRKIFNERAKEFPDIRAEAAYVDAVALWMVQKPWMFDVMVTENMFGDILSDLGAGLMGGLGVAPSADIGDRHAVFQPCHGSAPDIAGQGIANPTGMILSAAMMLEWLGETQDAPAASDAGAALRRAVARALGDEAVRTPDLGGGGGTAAFGAAVEAALDAELSP